VEELKRKSMPFRIDNRLKILNEIPNLLSNTKNLKISIFIPLTT
jgi:hypothetical protein